MGTTHPLFTKPLLRTVQITYHCDITRSGSPVIPLGVMCDFAVAHQYGIGLMTRGRITDGESELVGRLVREAITEPFDMLLKEYERVIVSSNHVVSFSELPLAHHGALTFAAVPPKVVALPVSLNANLENDDALSAYMEDRLSGGMSESFYDLLNEDTHWLNLSRSKRNQRVLRAA